MKNLISIILMFSLISEINSQSVKKQYLCNGNKITYYSKTKIHTINQEESASHIEFNSDSTKIELNHLYGKIDSIFIADDTLVIEHQKLISDSIILIENNSENKSLLYTNNNGKTKFKWHKIEKKDIISELNILKLNSSDYGDYELIIIDTITKCQTKLNYNIPFKKEEIAVFETANKFDSIYRYFKVDCLLKETDILGNELDNIKEKIAYQGYRFYIVNELENSFIIRFLKWPTNDNRNKELYFSNDSNSSKYRYFKISKDDLENKTSLLNSNNWKDGNLVISSIILPIKLRFKGKNNSDLNISKDISIGTFIGWRQYLYDTRPYLISYGFSFGLTSILLTKENTNSEIVQNNYDVLGFTISPGIVFQFNKAQLGLSYGWDWISNNKSQNINWNYQGSHWLGIGLGYNILAQPKPDRNNNISQL